MNEQEQLLTERIKSLENLLQRHELIIKTMIPIIESSMVVIDSKALDLSGNIYKMGKLIQSQFKTLDNPTHRSIIENLKQQLNNE